MAGKPEQPASHSGPTTLQQQQPQQQLSSLSRQQQQQQQQQQQSQQQSLQEQQAALQNSVLVYVSGDNLAYASAIDQQNALASFQQQQQQQQNNQNNQINHHHQQQQQHQQQQDAFLHLPQVFGDKQAVAAAAAGFLHKEEFVTLASGAAELEVQDQPLRTSSRGSDEDSGRSLGPEDEDDCLVADGSFVVSQLEAVVDGADIIYQDDVVVESDDASASHEPGEKESSHLKLLKLPKDMLDGCNGFATAVNGVYAASLGFPLDEKSLQGAFAAAELAEACDANGNHQVAFVRSQNGLALYQNNVMSDDHHHQQQQQQQQQQHQQQLDDQNGGNVLSDSGASIISAGQVIKITESGAFANLGSCDSVRSDTAESTCSSLSSHESQEVALQQAASFVAQQAARDAAVAAQQQQQQQVLGVHQVLDDAMNSAGACGSAVQQQQQQTQLRQQHELQQQHQLQGISVPPGWKRICTNGVIIYIR